MKERLLTRTMLFLPLLFAFAMLTSAQEPAQPAGAIFDAPANISISDFGNTYTHYTSPANIVANQSVLDHPLLNNNPTAVVFVTQQFNGPAHDSFVGVAYVGNQWVIFNQDNSPMPGGLSFVVQILSVSDSVFQFLTSPLPGQPYRHAIDHPLLNGNPLARVQLTSTWTYNAANTGIAFNAPYGVEYVYSLNKWVLYTTNFTTMPTGAAFNIQILDGASRDITYIHTTAPANITNFYSWLDHPLLNDNPYALLMVTGIRGAFKETINDVEQPIMVGYDSDSGRWAILMADGFSAMLTEADFIVTLLRTMPPVEEVVLNAGFEVSDAYVSNKLAGWVEINNGRRVCNRPSKGKTLSYEQYCAALVPGGNGLVNGVRQTLADIAQFEAGSTAHLGARVMGRGVTPGAKIMAIFRLSNGVRFKLRIPGTELLGSYPYKAVQGISAPLSANAVNVKIKVVHRWSGKIFVDAVYLSKYNLSIVYNEPEGELNTIPLPEEAP